MAVLRAHHPLGRRPQRHRPRRYLQLQNLNTKAGSIKVEGVDVALHYKFPSTAVGDFKAGLDWSFTRQYVATLVYGSQGFSSQELSGTTTNGAGTVGTGSETGGIPKRCARLDLSWAYGDWSASWNVQYISPLIEDCNSSPVVNPPSRCPLSINMPFESGAVARYHIGATYYHVVQATYHLENWSTDISLGVRNLFDKQPHVSMDACVSRYLPTYYRTPGHFFWTSMGVKF